ncbi:MAG: molybdate ABC transporter substrate-binding protein [Prolixibacteraceae bacterium]
MKRTVPYIIVLILFFLACVRKKNNAESELVVFCAASLTDVVAEITSEYEKENDVQVNLNVASSGTLARQLEHAATPSVFISANKKWMEYLSQKNLTEKETEKIIAGNSMVLITPLKSSLEPFPFEEKLNLPQLFEGRLSIGDPNHVPAGIYAMQVLENLGSKEELESRLLPAKNVRSALMVVELGEVEAGIVYKTDAIKSEKVKIITEFPDSLSGPIYYYMTIIKAQKTEKSLSLYNYILSNEVKKVWKNYGFTF